MINENIVLLTKFGPLQTQRSCRNGYFVTSARHASLYARSPGYLFWGKCRNCSYTLLRIDHQYIEINTPLYHNILTNVVKVIYQNTYSLSQHCFIQLFWFTKFLSLKAYSYALSKTFQQYQCFTVVCTMHSIRL